MTATILERLAELRAAHSDATAITSIAPSGARRRWSWAEMLDAVEQAATRLRAAEVTRGNIVMIAMTSGLEHIALTLGAWKIGAVPMPVNPSATDLERGHLERAIGPAAVATNQGLDARPNGRILPGESEDLVGRSAVLTGGTTGIPRVILSRAIAFSEAFLAFHQRMLALNDTQLVVSPLYHFGHNALYEGLLLDHEVIVLERFVPRLAAEAIETFGVTVVQTVPTQMKWLLESPAVARADLSTIRTLHHTAAACPPAVKRWWIDRLGPTRVWETYSSREALLITYVRGDEWLQRPGTVGWGGYNGRHLVRILRADLSEAPIGEVGRVFSEPQQGLPEYLAGDTQLTTVGGYASVGDLGYLDADGYLYLVERESEMFISGGVNIYPNEIELVIRELPGVIDAAVTGIEHDELGRVGAALVVAGPGVTTEAVREHCASVLAPHKVPHVVRLVPTLPRDASGKLRRSEVRQLSVPQ